MKAVGGPRQWCVASYFSSPAVTVMAKSGGFCTCPGVHELLGREAREAPVAFWVRPAPVWYSLGVTGRVTGCSL